LKHFPIFPYCVIAWRKEVCIFLQTATSGLQVTASGSLNPPPNVGFANKHELSASARALLGDGRSMITCNSVLKIIVVHENLAAGLAALTEMGHHRIQFGEYAN